MHYGFDNLTKPIPNITLNADTVVVVTGSQSTHEDVAKGTFIGLSVEFHDSHVANASSSCADAYGRNDDRCEAEFSQLSMGGTAKLFGVEDERAWTCADVKDDAISSTRVEERP